MAARACVFTQRRVDRHGVRRFVAMVISRNIRKWSVSAGMVVYYQKLPEEVTDLPIEQTEEIATFVEQYS